MALYLQMDGVDDYFTAPSHSYDEIIMTFSAKIKPSVSQMYVDGRPGQANAFVLRGATNTDTIGSAFTSVFVDGVQKTTATAFVPNEQKILLRAVRGVTSAVAVYNFFRNNLNAQFTEAKVYDVKGYKAGALAFHYDMTTGTVNDQSGNGRHATLNGGTWLDDGGGGATTHDGTATLTGQSLLDTSGLTIKNAAVNLLGNGQFTVTGEIITSTPIVDGVANLLGQGSFSVSSIATRLGQSDLTGQGFMTVNADVIHIAVTIDGEFNALGTGIFSVSGQVAGTPIVGEIHLNGNQTATIYLKGNKQSTIRINGNNTSNIHLKGVIR